MMGTALTVLGALSLAFGDLVLFAPAEEGYELASFAVAAFFICLGVALLGWGWAARRERELKRELEDLRELCVRLGAKADYLCREIHGNRNRKTGV